MGRRHSHHVPPKDIFVLVSDASCGKWAEFSPELTLEIERLWTLLAKLSSRCRATIFSYLATIFGYPQNICLPAVNLGFYELFRSSGGFNKHKLPLWLLH